MFYIDTPKDAKISKSTFEGNSAKGEGEGEGGAIFISSSENALIS